MRIINRIEMKEKRLIEIGEWLNTQGFDLDLSDDFWMEDCRFGEHKVRDIAELLDDFCNQEVERRIAERMPDINIEEAEEMAKATDYACFAVESPGNPINFADAASFFLEGWYACCSRLTNPESSQKTEGGEG
jgi:hypothetical protein